MKFPFLVLAVIVILIAALMSGCTATVGVGQQPAIAPTPRQTYNALATLINVSELAIAIDYAAKPPSAAQQAATVQAEALAANQMAMVNAWLVANPTLADTPGAACPPLDPLQIAANALGVLVPHPIPISTGPTTKPGG